MAFFAAYPDSYTVTEQTNVLFSEVLVNDGEGQVGLKIAPTMKLFYVPSIVQEPSTQKRELRTL